MSAPASGGQAVGDRPTARGLGPAACVRRIAARMLGMGAGSPALADAIAPWGRHRRIPAALALVTFTSATRFAGPGHLGLGDRTGAPASASSCNRQ